MPRRVKKESPFFIFLKEVSKQWNISYHSAEARERAGKMWDQMSKEQKARYGSGVEEDKFTSTGENIRFIEASRAEERAKAKKEEDFFDQLKTLPRMEVLSKRFFVITLNTYCHLSNYTNFAEVSIVPFSIRGGVEPPKTIILGFDEKKLGYDSVIREGAAECGMEPPPLKEAMIHPDRILDEIITFIKRDEEFPPLYTRQRELSELLLERLCELTEEPNRFRIYGLESLFFVLANISAVNDKDKLPQVSLAEMRMNTAAYLYHMNSACRYHKAQENYFKCSQSVALDVIYSILKHCGKVADIPVTLPSN